MDLLKKITTEYVHNQDRFSLRGAVNEEQVVVVWLTRRLLKNMLVYLVQWVEDQCEPGVSKPAVLEFSQQLAQSKVQPQAPVPKPSPQKTSREWLATSVDVKSSKDFIRLVFKAEEGDCVGLDMSSTLLRQWLDILYREHQKSGWTLEVWPNWIEGSVVKAVEPKQLH